MNDNFGASNKIIHEAGVTVQSLDENLKMDAVLSESLSDGKTNKKWKKRMKREDKKATNIDEVTSIDKPKIEEGSMQNLAGGNETEKRNKKLKSKKAKVKDEIQSLDQTNMDTTPTKDLAEGDVAIEDPIVKDEVQSVDQSRLDTRSTKNLAEVQVTRKRKKKRKCDAMINDEVQREAEGKVTIKNPKSREDAQSIGQANMDIIGSRENLDEGNVIIKNPKVQDDVQRIDQTEMDTGPTENSAEVHASGKHKKKRKSKAKISVEVQREVDTGSIENLAEGNGTIEKPKNREDVQSIGQTNMVIRLTENLAEGNVIIKNPKIQDDVQCVDQSEMDTGPTENSAEAHMTSKRKKKRKSKIKINVEVQREVNTGAIRNLAEGSATIVKPNIREDVQDIGQTNLYTGSTENFAERNVMIIKNPKIQDDVQSMDQTEMDTGPTGSSAEGIVTGKRKKKRKGRVKIKDEAQSNIGTSSTENLAQGNAVNEIPKIKDEVQSTGMDKMDAGSKDTWSTENLAEGNVFIKNIKIQDEAHSMDQNKMDTGRTEKSTKGNVSGKRKEKRKIKDEVQSDINTRPMENLDEGYLTTEKPKTTMDAWSTENLAEGNMTIENLNIQDEAQSMDQAKVETGPAENSAEGKIGKRKKKQKRKRQTNYEVESVDARPTEELPEGNVTIDNPNIQDEAQSTDQTKMETWPTENSAKGNVSGKRKRQRKSKAETKDEVLSVVDTRTTENLAVGNVTTKKPKINDEVQSTELSKMDTVSTENLAEGNEAHSRDQTEMGTGPTENSVEVNVTRNRKKKEKIKAEASRKMDTESTENLPEGKVYAEGTSAISTSDVKDAKDMCSSPITPVRRKLLVLDVNGLLADIVYSAPNHCKGDIKIFGRAVFKRPFCDDFLKFCFQNFDVGIWSSRSKKIIEPVVNFLLGDQKDKLLFCWDMDHATKTKFNTLENKHKPLVCKELSKIWENDDCNLPWKKEDYDESNTLLLDDSPYKALLNPLHTAIFPSPYQYDNENDDSLGPGGNLRVYLEGLVTAENVQKYVEQHPFGQRPITEEHCSWEFYKRVRHQVSKAVEGKISLPNSVNGINSMPNPVDGITLMPSPEEGKTSLPSPLEGRTSMPIPEEGKTSMLNPEEGKILISNPVEGKSLTPKSVKGRDVKRVEAQQTGPFKPKKKKARATFLWPI